MLSITFWAELNYRNGKTEEIKSVTTKVELNYCHKQFEFSGTFHNICGFAMIFS